ncbi:hypothetical protein NAEGRDRAFT_79492 [Naegleria gruberi]|uniref:Uncharacterized protein n=1 Tax=Naegleria gruberi TaxID=5762 RepID=D2VDD0_NAEGR|nr:uncharacterized protein NAEGRDRAFT_79492 [Naegleria gruberi]EFC45209.1 hypothetical protein NAEGRDRAFT_79492 [Naegleria gruberi]|eukprot:XP_002677953.1 hypothetical protein NAEGRDRAFT_79492 [Naegleria gruberi strain NEG-M]
MNESKNSSKKNFHKIELKWMNQIDSAVFVDTSNRDADVNVLVTSRKIKNQEESPKDILFRTHHYEMRKRKITPLPSTIPLNGPFMSPYSLANGATNNQGTLLPPPPSSSSTVPILTIEPAADESEESNDSECSEATAAENLLSISVAPPKREDPPVAMPKVFKSYKQLQQQKSESSNSQESSASPTKVRVAQPFPTIPPISPKENTTTTDKKSNKPKNIELSPKKKKSAKETNANIDPSLFPPNNNNASSNNGADSPGTMIDSAGLLDSSIPFTPFDDIINSVDPTHFTLCASGNNGQEEEFKEFATGLECTPVITYSFTEDPTTRNWVVELFWPTEKKALSWRGKFCFYISIFRKDMASNSYKLVMSKISSQFAVFSKPDVFLKKIKSSTTKKPEPKKKEKQATPNTWPMPSLTPSDTIPQPPVVNLTPSTSSLLLPNQTGLITTPQKPGLTNLEDMAVHFQPGSSLPQLPPLSSNIPGGMPLLPNPTQLLQNSPFPPPSMNNPYLNPMGGMPLGKPLPPPFAMPPLQPIIKQEQESSTTTTEGPLKKQKLTQ